MPKIPKVAKTWTPSQSARLADQGYYIVSYGNNSKPPLESMADFIYIGAGHCQYARTWSPSHASSTPLWNTLLWSCAPTKKQVAKASLLAPTEKGYRYYYFKDYTTFDTYLKTNKFFHAVPPAPADTGSIISTPGMSL
jgi:hypothetical protein